MTTNRIAAAAADRPSLFTQMVQGRTAGRRVLREDSFDSEVAHAVGEIRRRPGSDRIVWRGFSVGAALTAREGRVGLLCPRESAPRWFTPDLARARRRVPPARRMARGAYRLTWGGFDPEDEVRVEHAAATLEGAIAAALGLMRQWQQVDVAIWRGRRLAAVVLVLTPDKTRVIRFPE